MGKSIQVQAPNIPLIALQSKFPGQSAMNTCVMPMHRGRTPITWQDTNLALSKLNEGLAQLQANTTELLNQVSVQKELRK